MTAIDVPLATRLGPLTLAPLPVPRCRWLRPGDGPRLTALVRACYGETYSQRSLYDAGELDALWASGTLASAGELDERGELVGHTAFWHKDPHLDSVDSCLSFVHPRHRLRAGHDAAALWPFFLEQLGRTYAFVHQATTTVHALAQRYAQRRMRAVPTGLVVGWAVDEDVVGFGRADAMHAVSMTSYIATTVASPRRCAVPDGPWAGWLEETLAGGPVPRCAERVAPETSSQGDGWTLRSIERSAGLSLERRVLAPRPGAEALPAHVWETPARVDLVHLAVDDAGVMARGAPLLRARGYLPVGVRLHLSRPDEIVFQRFAGGAAAARAAIAGARLAAGAPRTLFEGWSEACARAS